MKEVKMMATGSEEVTWKMEAMMKLNAKATGPYVSLEWVYGGSYLCMKSFSDKKFVEKEIQGLALQLKQCWGFEDRMEQSRLCGKL